MFGRLLITFKIYIGMHLGIAQKLIVIGTNFHGTWSDAGEEHFLFDNYHDQPEEHDWGVFIFS